MTVITDLVTPTAVQTLGWTLLHFLWQGVRPRSFVAVLLWLTKARVRLCVYGLACAGLAVMLLLPGLTYAVLRPQVEAATELSYDLVVPSAQPLTGGNSYSHPTPTEPARPNRHPRPIGYGPTFRS
jgi:hypothetical protein